MCLDIVWFTVREVQTHTHTHTHTHKHTHTNTQFGINAEHSWADAPIVGYVLEYCCNLEHKIGYREDGSCNGVVQTTPPKPQRLKWNISPEVGVWTFCSNVCV